MRIANKRTVAVAVAVAVVLMGGAAYAFFTSTGAGTGGATVGTASPWLVSNVGATGGPLLPGSGVQAVTYTVTNGSDGRQQLNSVAASVAADANGNVLDTANSNAPVPGCLAAWFAVDNAGAPTTPAVLAGGGSVTGTANVTMTDSGTNQNSCQSISPELSITVS